MPNKRKAAEENLLICLGLVLATVAVYGQVRDFAFVQYDDPLYVWRNSRLHAGLSLASLGWAFTDTSTGNWHPLTWISHLLDVELFGVDPGMHHVTNLILHCVNSLLLFLVLRRMTGARWPSAVAAFLFALHPLHVESVAWVSERKDVLSGLFCILTLLSYAGYVEKPGVTRYGLVALCFALGLMAKPMLVTMPLVLLLLDYWPLGRFASACTLGRERRTEHMRRALILVLEKAPLGALAAASSLAALWAQETGGGLGSLERFSLGSRIANAVTSYVLYTRDMLWPQRLAFFYPYHKVIPLWQAGLCAMLLVAITLLVIRLRRRYPFLVTGWWWYLITLLPVIGLVQVGIQSRADRYTYLPLIGLFIIVSWGIDRAAEKWRIRPLLLALGGVAATLVLMGTSFLQAGYWKNSVTVAAHALAVTDRNYVALNTLGAAYTEQEKLDKAIDCFVQALRFNPRYSDAEYNLANTLLKKGDLEAAALHYRAVLRRAPSMKEAYSNLGVVLARQGNYGEAIACFEKVLALRPDDQGARDNLALAQKKRSLAAPSSAAPAR